MQSSLGHQIFGLAIHGYITTETDQFEVAPLEKSGYTPATSRLLRINTKTGETNWTDMRGISKWSNIKEAWEYEEELEAIGEKRKREEED